MCLNRLLKANGLTSLFKPITEDDLIEAVADQEFRICCLELGIDANELLMEE